MWQNPVQNPPPPILLGGESGHTLQRVVDFCGGWSPRGRAGDVIFTGLADLRARAARAGRHMKPFAVSVFGAKPEAAAIDRHEAAGVTRGILRWRSEPRDRVLPLLDQYAK